MNMQLPSCMCIFVYFDNIVDKLHQFTEGDNNDIVIIIKDEHSSTFKKCIVYQFAVYSRLRGRCI